MEKKESVKGLMLDIWLSSTKGDTFISEMLKLLLLIDKI